MAINALDFKSDIPFVFDRLCAKLGIYVLHPYKMCIRDRILLEKLEQLSAQIIALQEQAVSLTIDYRK